MNNHSEARMGRQDAAAPFRPMAAALAEIPTRSYRIREGGRVEVKLPRSKRRPSELCAFHVVPISSDIGGVAYRLFKMDGSGTSYDVLVGGGNDSCTCPGFCWRERACKHYLAVRTLIDLGILKSPPGSAAADQGEGGGGGRAA